MPQVSVNRCFIAPSGQSFAVYWAWAGTASMRAAAAANRCVFMTFLSTGQPSALGDKVAAAGGVRQGRADDQMRLFHERKIVASILMLRGDPSADLLSLVFGHRSLVTERHRLVLHRLRQ